MQSYRNLGQDFRQAYEQNGSLSIGFSPGAGRSRLHCGAAVHLRPKPPAGRTNRDATGRSHYGSLNLKASVTICKDVPIMKLTEIVKEIGETDIQN